jgi:hypothetical protein
VASQARRAVALAGNGALIQQVYSVGNPHQQAHALPLPNRSAQGVTLLGRDQEFPILMPAAQLCARLRQLGREQTIEPKGAGKRNLDMD